MWSLRFSDISVAPDMCHGSLHRVLRIVFRCLWYQVRVIYEDHGMQRTSAGSCQ